jgi:hypothetical protein
LTRSHSYISTPPATARPSDAYIRSTLLLRAVDAEPLVHQDPSGNRNVQALGASEERKADVLAQAITQLGPQAAGLVAQNQGNRTG